MAATAQQGGTSRAARELAADLLPRAGVLAREMTDYLSTTIPELATTEDEDLRAEIVAGAEANIAQILRLLADEGSPDDAFVPAEALEGTRGLVRRGIALAVLLRSYRVGHAWLWERWSQALQERAADADEFAAGQEQASSLMFGYIDRISDALVEEFGTERERLVRSAAQLRAETVRAILDGALVDEEAASRRLGYDLARQHVGMQVAARASEVRGLERAVQEAAAVLRCGDPLVIATGAARYDVWCGSFELIATDPLAAYEPPGGVLVAFGRPAAGIAGFRASHLEALQAARVAALARGALGAVTSYAEVELVSLLAADLPRARAFVAAQLGPLASTGEPAQRLRETVLAFLGSGGSATRVAKELYVHQNTVAYRVKKAEELLGHKVGERPIALACALTLTAALGSAVLAEEDGGAEFE